MTTTNGPDVDSSDLRVKLRTGLGAARRELIAATQQGQGGCAAIARFSDRVDDLIRELVKSTHTLGETPLAVCAVGGYGRHSLCLCSDVDLLVLFGGGIGRPEERVLKALLTPLWDLNFVVGHHVRERAEFGRFESDNPEFLLALLDIRFLEGDRDLHAEFETRTRATINDKNAQVLDTLFSLTDQRHAEFHDTLYQLEPDVKDVPGGLRDIWATRTILKLADGLTGTAETCRTDRLQDAEEFLLRVRSLLHLDSGRNLNVFGHEHQEKFAQRLGYAGPDLRHQVEGLMSDYFRHARLVWRAQGRARRAARPAPPTPLRLIGENLMWVVEGITFADTARAAAAPASWLKVFEAAVSRNVPVADDAVVLIEREQEVGGYGPDALLPTREARQHFVQFLRPRPGLAARLREMRDCGLLGALLPEMDKISCRVTRDFYHKYTVDEHTLLTVRNVERLLEHDRFGPVLRELRSPEILVLALLYHDVGKWTDGNHSIEGARMAASMAERLGLDADARQTIDFLIRNHLVMSRIAFRRDTEEPDVIRQFASLFGTEEHLKMLFLLTVADVGAVSPETLTPWKEELLWRLFVDAYNQMTLAYGDEIIDRDQAVLASLQSRRPDDISEADMARFLEGLPRRYLTLFTPDNVYRHVRLSRDIRADDVHFFVEQKTDVWELTVVTHDKPFLFSNICGVLSYFGMDILRGHALTSLGGLVLDVFQFTDRESFFELNPEARSQFDRCLEAVVGGRTDVTVLLKGKRRSVLFRRAPRRRAPRIHFDNEHSQRYTVLELIADDAPGLLHRISRVISTHGCDVDLVLISTEGQKAIDVFHITRGAAKLSEDDQQRLKADLERMLEESE